MKDKLSDILLKFSAFFIPFYFVFYWKLHEKPESPKMKTLWKFVFSGFATYVILVIIIVLNRDII